MQELSTALVNGVNVYSNRVSFTTIKSKLICIECRFSLYVKEAQIEYEVIWIPCLVLQNVDLGIDICA